MLDFYQEFVVCVVDSRVLIIKENVDQFTKPKCYILPLMRSKVGSLTESFTVRLEILRVAFKHSFSFFFLVGKEGRGGGGRGGGKVKHHVLNTETLFLCIKREWWSLLI